MNYFSDTELGEKERVLENITEDIYQGIISTYKKYAAKNSFSESAPMNCPDRYPGVCGFDEKIFINLAKAEIRNLDLEDCIGDDCTYMILDFVQFCYSHVKKANQGNYISYIDGLTEEVACTLSYTFEESDSEKENFKNDINRLFRRNSLVFELQENGEIRRVVPSGMNPLISKLYITSDDILNDLVSEAFEHFTKVRIMDRRRAVEKIWDAYDRMKTYYEEKDTKASINELVDLVSKDNDAMKSILENETENLRNIGNNGIAIRHHETNKIPIEKNEHIDFVFYKMVNLMQLFLKHLERNSNDK